MKLRFLGIVPDTGKDDSPTVWMDEDSGDLLIQSYKATEEEVKAPQEGASIPGRGREVSRHEVIVRMPKVMQAVPAVRRGWAGPW
ncbi:hypothetical protein AB0I22_25235 [Streptomyces sp. NPDC050610]|uniref:hypothetical protein n=1 Tax=Streptomyces sp. NPDC050610 TaxID=3157097 RepID=UPI003413E803